MDANPCFVLVPEDGKPGLTLHGITYQQALTKASELAEALRKPVHVHGITRIATQQWPWPK